MPAPSRFQKTTLRILNVVYTLALVPFRRSRGPGLATEDPARVARTDEYIAAAERYYAEFPNRPFLLNKPFSEPASLSKHLIDTGVLLSALQVAPGDTVVEIGAGTCWLSHILNRYGCRTISVDVSPTALELGRKLFETDPHTNWSLNPGFVSFDGRLLPLDDRSADAIVINDAFHHVPNQRQLLTEMRRILRPGGIAAMSEPGRGHGTAAHSVEEAAEFGVLENELVLEDLAALARDCGFAGVNVLIQSPFSSMEIDARKVGAFMGGKGFADYWKTFCGNLDRHHYLVLHTASAAKTTRRTAGARAQIEASLAGAAISFRITNSGDSTWLGGDVPRSGWTRIGAHLYKKEGGATRLVDFDWWRHALPEQVRPGQTVTMSASLPQLGPGHYELAFDLVIEGLAWFATLDSPVTRIEMRVE